MDFPEVTIQQGRLKGYKATALEGREYFSFCGIPFAEPPVGDLRFKDPVPIKKWTGVRDATKDGNKAAQIVIFGNEYSGEEDCLYLNVHTPKLPSKGSPLLPVMVCLHGGGFVYGTGNKDENGPDYIVNQDTILVSMNYRLSIFGFLCLESVEAPGNMGLKDQNLALKWIQQNIKAFNGDPNNVTIYGISAGGASVEYQVLSPLSKGLFHKAIIQSGSVFNFWARSRDTKKFTNRLLDQLGCPSKEPAEIVKFLRQFGSEHLLKVTVAIHQTEDLSNGDLFAFVPVVCSIPGHEDFLTEEPLKAFKSGNFNKVPILAGYCEKEGIFMKKFYASVMDDLENKNFTDFLPPAFTIERNNLLERMQDIYKVRATDKNPDDYIIDYLSDLSFLGGMYVSLPYRLKYCPANYLYVFTHEGKLNFLEADYPEKGTCHADETTYLMVTSELDPNVALPKDIIVRDRFVEMWTQFAKTGNPTPALSKNIDKIWPEITTYEFNMMNIGEDLEVLKKEPRVKRKELWEEFYASMI